MLPKWGPGRLPRAKTRVSKWNACMQIFGSGMLVFEAAFYRIIIPVCPGMGSYFKGARRGQTSIMFSVVIIIIADIYAMLRTFLIHGTFEAEELLCFPIL